MASSSSSASSSTTAAPVASSSSSASSSTTAAPVLSDRHRLPRHPTGAAAPAASAAPVPGAIASATAPGVGPGAIASASMPDAARATASATASRVTPGAIASASTPGVSRLIPRPPVQTGWGSKNRVPGTTDYRVLLKQKEGRTGKSVRVPHPQRRRRNSMARSTFAPVMSSSPSTSAWNIPLPYVSKAASNPTDIKIASTGSSSSTTPSRSPSLDIASTSASSSACGVSTIVDPALELDTFAPSADPALQPDASATASSSAPTSADRALEPDASTSFSSFAQQPASTPANGIGMHPIRSLYPDPLWEWREEVPPSESDSSWPEEVAPWSFSFLDEDDMSPDAPLCGECGLRPALFDARPCRHFAICLLCYEKRFVCPCCGMLIHWGYIP